jgi:hypothetical protein
MMMARSEKSAAATKAATTKIVGLLKDGKPGALANAGLLRNRGEARPKRRVDYRGHNLVQRQMQWRSPQRSASLQDAQSAALPIS